LYQDSPTWKNKYTPCKNSKHPMLYIEEKWLDFHENENSFFCENYFYVTAIRHPLDRVKSTLNQIDIWHQDRQFIPGETINISSAANHISLFNYMTWSLVADKMLENPVKTFTLKPNETWLEVAKETLAGMDIIFNFFDYDKNCYENIFESFDFNFNQFLEMKPEKVHRREYDSRFGSKFLNDLKVYNQLDLKLFEYGEKLIKLDCMHYELMKSL
jgi:hypothetical protein